jgi:DNA-binding transcriptional ArsR family regulator
MITDTLRQTRSNKCSASAIRTAILHELSMDHLSRMDLMCKLVQEFRLSERTLHNHINDLVEEELVMRMHKTSQQYYRLSTSGYIHLLGIISKRQ